MRSVDPLYGESSIGVGAVHGRNGPRVAVSVVISEDPGPPPSVTSSMFLATGGGAVISFSVPTNQVHDYSHLRERVYKITYYVSSGWFDKRKLQMFTASVRRCSIKIWLELGLQLVKL